MTYSNNPSQMPGAFNVANQRDHGSAPRLSGAKSHIFQPPRTRSDSASSSLLLTRSTTSSSTARRPSFAPRKRSRAESPSPMEDEWANGTEGAPDRCPGSPKPFVNTKYVLAGGMDTPTLKAAQLDSEYSDLAYRKSLAEDGMRHTRRGLFSDMDGGSPGGEGWSKAAIQVVGGVAGKIWEFCKTGSSVFRGFHAGVGKGYTIENSESTSSYHVEETESFWETEKQSTWGPPDRESTPVPGQFPEFDDRSTTPEARPSKRRQVSRNNTQDEIAKNWVVVPTPPPTTPSKPVPQIRGPSRYSMPTASSAGRRSTASTARPVSRAGFAPSTGPRRPMLSRVSHAGSLALTPNRGASYASPRSSPGSNIPRASSPMRATSQKAPDSPAAKEAQRWATQKKKEEREADESIRRLDRQLKAMIREGKEALGTKIEVDISDDDFGRGSRKWDI
ncbi:hypothetical protein LSUE1_G008899 [Lachnellula suecica]|uniref:Uncharacterized protein n=1 Tax=Lachnellula suecica TaxID=602035 RepID=A0A8T9BSH8_9HELO|nr:hypothetical protein LSUE1_G008899 [Lachnellula suecica]